MLVLLLLLLLPVLLLLPSKPGVGCSNLGASGLYGLRLRLSARFPAFTPEDRDPKCCILSCESSNSEVAKLRERANPEPYPDREPLACKKCSHSSQTRDLANIGESEAQNPENLNPKHGKTQTSAQKTQKTCGHPNFSCRLSESQKSPILASTQAGSPGQAPPLPFDTLALQPKSRTRRNES